MTTNGHTVNFKLGAGNRLTMNIDQWDSGNIAYDMGGRVIEFVDYTDNWWVDDVFAWNSREQLVYMESIITGYLAYFTYDPLGRRIRRWDSVSTNVFIYDGQQVVADLDATGGVERTYVWGPGIDNLLSMTVRTGATAVTYYAVKDHLGTVHALTDENGNVAESYRFDAWGNILAVFDASGAPLTEKRSLLGNRYLWQGREYDWQTGYYYFRARWYEPRTGRWLSNDPIGISGGLNQYVFCGNDPVNNRDPMGDDPFRVSIRADQDHAWISVTDIADASTHTYGRWKFGYGIPKVNKSGVIIDQERHNGIERPYKASRSRMVKKFIPTINEGYTVYSDNCSTYARDEWKRITGGDLDNDAMGFLLWDSPEVLMESILKANGGKKDSWYTK